MNKILTIPTTRPDHARLPDNDGEPVRNAQEPDQSTLLTETLEMRLQQTSPEMEYFIGKDCGIYWEKLDPPALGCKAPDWYFVFGVPRMIDGRPRRSYVMWEEKVDPSVILEYASDGGAEERDATPRRGKFWVYEQKIRPAFYGIFLPEEEKLEMYRREGGRFHLMAANEQGRYFIEPLGMDLGIWHGTFARCDLPWLRWWDTDGILLPTGEELAASERERAECERKRADSAGRRANNERKRADSEKERAEKLAAKLRSLGVDPDEL